MLKDNGITISMCRKGNPWDNAACESFMKTFKHEEVYRNEYRELAEARARSAGFWRRSTTRGECTPRWGTCRRRSSKPTSPPGKTRVPLRGSFLYEFSQACAIYRSDVGLSFAHS